MTLFGENEIKAFLSLNNSDAANHGVYIDAFKTPINFSCYNEQCDNLLEWSDNRGPFIFEPWMQNVNIQNGATAFFLYAHDSANHIVYAAQYIANLQYMCQSTCRLTCPDPPIANGTNSVANVLLIPDFIAGINIRYVTPFFGKSISGTCVSTEYFFNIYFMQIICFCCLLDIILTTQFV